jgi:hypothetical protein
VNMFNNSGRDIAADPVTPQHSGLAASDGDITPTLTPRPSFTNFRFSHEFGATAHAFGLAQAPRTTFGYSTMAPPTDLPFQNDQPCEGQWVDWYPGSIWDTYAYQQHEHKAIPWTLIGIQEGRVRLKSKTCTKYLASEGNPQTGEAVCQSCKALLLSPKLQRFMERASTDALPRTPWKYLNFLQITKLLVQSSKRARRYEVQVRIINYRLRQNQNIIISVKKSDASYTTVVEED